MNPKKQDGEHSVVFFSLQIPSPLEKKAEVMAEFLASVHRLLPHGTSLSLEIAVKKNLLRFYLVTSTQQAIILESQLNAYFPHIEIEKIDDYLPDLENASCAQIHLKHASVYPLKTYESLNESVLKSLIALLSKVDSQDEFYLQFMLKNVGSKPWQRGIRTSYQTLMRKDKEIQEKLAQDLYQGSLRLVYIADDKSKAKASLQTIGGIFKQLKEQNELQLRFVSREVVFKQSVKDRSTSTTDLWTSPEIATIYHFPYIGEGGIPKTTTVSRKSPAPEILPVVEDVLSEDLAMFGETTYQNERKIFGIKRLDRRRHMYVIGKTGSGKSRLLQLLLLSDIQNGHGCCLIDPHGDLAEELLTYIPKSRINDVVYVNPADKDFPIGFNPLEAVEDYDTRQHLSRFFIAIFKKLFAESWNPRMEHLIRYITLALLETPDSNILGMQRMLTDTQFRQRVIKHIKDPIVKSFWTTEFSASNEQFISAAAVPLMNKLGQFIAHPTIRNMVGQRKNMLDFEKFMNEGKIVIINLPKGKLGEDNVALLGSMFITKIQQAALARAKMKEDERRDFYFYVDEFQNFATDAFSSILSESRKYHLNITVAHQYMAQLTDEIKTAVFGNIASLVVFSVGGNDAKYLQHEFAPIFDKEDMLSLEAREMYIKLCIDGRLTQPFSARTLTIPTSEHDFSREIITKSQMTYGTNKVAVENEIRKWSDTSEFVESEKDQTFPEPLV